MPVTLHHAQVFSRAKAVRDAHARFCDDCLPGLYDLPAMPPTQIKTHHHPGKAVDVAGASKGLPDDASRVALLIGLYQKLTMSALARRQARPHSGAQNMQTKPRNLDAKTMITAITAAAASRWQVRLSALSLALSLCACGMETAATAAAAAKMQAQQAQAAQQQLQAAKQQLEQANAQLEARKQSMDAASQ